MFERHTILCFVDRASRYICVIKTNRMHYLSSVYFVNQPVHISGIFVTHHQEVYCILVYTTIGRLCLKYDGTRAETIFRLSAKRTSPFKSAGASVQSTTGSRGVSISDSNAGYTTFRGSVKSTGCSLHSPVSPSVFLPCVTFCNHISTGLYDLCFSVDCLLSQPGQQTVN